MSLEWKVLIFFDIFSKKKRKNETNEVGFRFHELSLGQNVPLDCGNNLGLFLAKNSRKRRGKVRFFLLSSSLLPAFSYTDGRGPAVGGSHFAHVCLTSLSRHVHPSSE